MTSAVIVSTARTPLTKAWKGALNMTHGATMGGHVVRAALDRAGVAPDEVEDVTFTARGREQLGEPPERAQIADANRGAPVPDRPVLAVAPEHVASRLLRSDPALHDLRTPRASADLAEQESDRRDADLVAQSRTIAGS